ncbi:MAG: F0F1 ATP synthase subunit epsilon [Alphaproteobacteria bacterium]|nr:F0F1 ATP synthase subunit epsilon [Alphaproteobacteria bacterium]
MKVKVLELEKKLYDGEALKVLVPAVEGEMCLLPNHISIVTSLSAGRICIFRPDSDRPISIDVSGGICSFANNQAVFILE